MPAGVASGTRKRRTSVTGRCRVTVERCVSGGRGSPIARPATCVSVSRSTERASCSSGAEPAPSRTARCPETPRTITLPFSNSPAAASTRTVDPGPGTSTAGVAPSATGARAETVTTRAPRASRCNALRMTNGVSRFAGTYTISGRRRPVSQAPHKAQARPRGVDRADLVVDEALGQADLAHEILVEVRGDAGAALGPSDPEAAGRLQRGREGGEA